MVGSLRDIGPTRMAAVLLPWLALGCAEYAPELSARSPSGCWVLEAGAWDPPLEPGPVMAAARAPTGVELGERAYRVTVDDRDRELHRFDPERASEAHFILPDTTLRVAWWLGDADTVAMGNHNRWAGWYVAGLVRGDRLQGELRWVRYDAEGEGVEAMHRAPVTGRREGCGALR